jgi:sugar phosphate isomerase/epimerase
MKWGSDGGADEHFTLWRAFVVIHRWQQAFDRSVKAEGVIEKLQVPRSPLRILRHRDELDRLRSGRPNYRRGFIVEATRFLQRCHQEKLVVQPVIFRRARHPANDPGLNTGFFQNFTQRGLLPGFPVLRLALGKRPDPRLVQALGFAQQHAPGIINQHPAVCSFHPFITVIALHYKPNCSRLRSILIKLFPRETVLPAPVRTPDNPPMNRRAFLQRAGVAAASLVAGSLEKASAAASPRAWPIGCFNRAWTNWSYDEALDGIAAAGYKLTGLLSAHRGEAFTSSSATPEYLASLKKRIAQRGLVVNMTAIRFRADGELSDNLKDLRQQIENAARLDLKFMLTFGVDRPSQYENFYRLMTDAAAEAEKHSIHIVLKPHGGGSGASEEILRCLRQVGHPNFKIWYDAGNIIYYTGKDPVAELEPIISQVTGFCAKDCPGPKGEVMSQFGTGKVDFKAVFARLKTAAFDGPIMVEGVQVSATPEETTANARANREFLEKVLRSV